MKAKTSGDDLINWWLKKYHDLTIEELVVKEPELTKTPEWYKKYAVTQSQHDEWREWAIKTLMKENRMNRKRVERNWWAVYLNTAPSINPNP
jgi:hypothetical protein